MKQTTEPPVNRMYKSRIFAMLYQEKKELLDLYNAISGKHYEHQSTYSPNLPLRNLFYISDLYSGMTKNSNLYGTKLVEIPAPQFVIFYNGIKEMPDRTVLRLSDAYSVKDEHPALELAAVMLNINRGHNEKLKELCKSLKDYSEYTARVREYANIMPISEAVEQAICECIQEGILAEFLTQNRAEAKQVSIYVYDEEKHMRQEREASWEEGWTTGRMELLKELIQKKWSKGMSVSEIAIELEEEEALISELIQELEK